MLQALTFFPAFSTHAHCAYPRGSCGKTFQAQKFILQLSCPVQLHFFAGSTCLFLQWLVSASFLTQISLPAALLCEARREAKASHFRSHCLATEIMLSSTYGASSRMSPSSLLWLFWPQTPSNYFLHKRFYQQLLLPPNYRGSHGICHFSCSEWGEASCHFQGNSSVVFVAAHKTKTMKYPACG